MIKLRPEGGKSKLSHVSKNGTLVAREVKEKRRMNARVWGIRDGKYGLAWSYERRQLIANSDWLFRTEDGLDFKVWLDWFLSQIDGYDPNSSN